jgi:hypothetical protein
MNYNDVFGKYTVPPSRDSYTAYELIADTQSYWPDNYAETGFTLAAINDLTSTGVHSLILPPANQVSVGKEIYLANFGSFNILVKDNAGVLLFSIPPTIGCYFYVKDNDTTKGEWRFVAIANAAVIVADNINDVNTVANNIDSVNINAANINDINTNADNIVAIQSASANALSAQQNALSAEASKQQASEEADRASAAALTLIAAGTILPTCSNTAFSDIYDSVIDLGTIELDPPTYFAIENIPVVRVDLSSSIENTQYDFAEL